MVLIIISLLAVSRCSLSCSCDREKFLNGFPFNDHPVLRRHKRYQHIIAPVSTQNGNASYHATYKEKDDNEVCVCAQCDDGAKTCTSKTYTTFDDAQKCCTTFLQYVIVLAVQMTRVHVITISAVVVAMMNRKMAVIKKKSGLS